MCVVRTGIDIVPKNDPQTRNSSLELLRIVSMLLIVNFHFLIRNGSYDLIFNQHPLNWTGFVFAVVGHGGGWVGNVVFFTISAWFLIDKKVDVKSSFRRVWMLEREVLFWSFTLGAISYFGKKNGILDVDFNKDLVLDTLFPLMRNVWWYATSYALFLILCPFLIVSLKALGKQMLGWLAGIVILIWGVLTLIPVTSFDSSHNTVFVMIMLFIIVAYYKWYCSPIRSRECALMIFAGCGLYIAYWLGFTLLFECTGRGGNDRLFIFNCILPPMLIGFGLFILFERIHFSNRLIDYIAKSTFGVYLITENPHIYPFYGRLCST